MSGPVRSVAAAAAGDSGTPAIGRAASSRQPAGELLGSERHDDDQRLHDDPSTHLRLADAPVAERDRCLGDARPAARCPERHLDLEDVAAGVDAVERDRRKRRRAPRLEPAGEVMRAEAQDVPGEDAAAAGDDPPPDAPVDDAAARRVARPDHEVGRSAGDRGDEGRQRCRVVRPVGVHLDHDLGPAGERNAEAVEVGPPEPLLFGPMADADPGVGGCELVRDLAGAVGRSVVDDEERRSGQALQDRGGDRPDVLRLVVGRQDDPGSGAGERRRGSRVVRRSGRFRARGRHGRASVDPAPRRETRPIVPLRVAQRK